MSRSMAYMMAIVMFCSISYHLRDIRKSNKMSKVWPWKWRLRSRRRKKELQPFDWKCSIRYKWFFSRILAIYEHTFTQSGNIRAARDSGTDYRQNLQRRFIELLHDIARDSGADYRQNLQGRFILHAIAYIIHCNTKLETIRLWQAMMTYKDIVSHREISSNK